MVLAIRGGHRAGRWGVLLGVYSLLVLEHWWGCGAPRGSSLEHCDVYRSVPTCKLLLDIATCVGIVSGQGIKDIVRWPRPGPPVVQLQKKWALEYGFPSTHAMVGVSIPFSIVLYTMNRYEYNIYLGLAVAFLWCTVICFSRLYLGMHSVLVSCQSMKLGSFEEAENLVSRMWYLVYFWQWLFWGH